MKTTTANRALTPILLLFASLAWAQDLPDPGRRLSRQEQEMTPEKLLEQQRKSSAQQSDVLRPGRMRDPELCERARLNKQITCGAPHSHQSRSLQCTEAHTYLDQNCY